MPQNLDMTTSGSTILPSVRYRDAHAAIDWLCRVFGFIQQAVYDGPNGTVAHAQLTHGAGMLMIGSAGNEGETGNYTIDLKETGERETVGLCLIAADCEAIYERVKIENAEILQELRAPEYGGIAFTCRDLEGHVWWIGSYDPWKD